MDIRTIYELTACVLLGVIGYLLLIQFSTPGLKGIRWFIVGYISAASGLELIALRNHLRHPIFILFSNTLLLFANLFIYWGVADLIGVKRHFKTILYVTSAPLLLISYFIFLHEQMASRVLVYSIANVIQFTLLILLVLRSGPARTRMPRVGLAIISLLWIVVHCVRAMQAIHNHPLSILDEGQSLNSFLLLVPVMTAVMTCMAFLWLAMAQLQSELEQQSHTDVLTGLLNRRALTKHAEREIAYATRIGTPLALLICDLDHFKSVNDRFGHDAGDVALSTAATCIVEALRTNDIVARLGGEEFVLLLPNTTEAGALLVAERTRLRLAALEIRYRSYSFTLTASFGVTTLQPGDRDLEDIIHRADKALYLAKDTGRNRTIVGEHSENGEHQPAPHPSHPGPGERRAALPDNPAGLQTPDPLHS
ncbi:diguanylate cyclase (GGDEF) domain-containing protein [Granulicella rosea]|uniref:diguanylate cyclase n=1 Tax=Granulicella rosea TaxID=474952 RepID=A0A239HVN8_9BACT|nr:GGDEF domain-containing protein [Granulicella rosea]SNS85301.1 diguanylate cyclase (GGDEF) domain-containing protein [Granulicella rosea]